jgi:hypothetical protein
VGNGVLGAAVREGVKEGLVEGGWLGEKIETGLEDGAIDTVGLSKGASVSARCR